MDINNNIEYITMLSIIEYNYDNYLDEFHKRIVERTPNLPTRRWNTITTKYSTSDLKNIKSIIKKMNDDGFNYKIIKNTEDTKKLKTKMYSVVNK